MSDDWSERVVQAEERRQRLLSFGENARGVLVATRHGLFAVDPEDSGVSASLLQFGSYGDAELDFAKSLVSNQSQILIVGAHLGALAIPLAHKCAQLVGIEANPNTFELLQANARLSGCNNIILFNVAASAADGQTIEFLLNRDNSGGSKRKPVSAAADYMYDLPEVVRLTTARVDTLVGERRFDLVIMDIEGSEIFALRGMPQILRTCRALAVEFRTHHIIDVAGATVEDFIPIVLPYFDWLHLPGAGLISGKEEIAARLRAMFAANECHDAIYFFKDRPAPDL